MGQPVECNLTGYSCNRQRDRQRERKKDSHAKYMDRKRDFS